MHKYKYLIQQGIKEPLESVQFHGAVPFERFVMLKKDTVEGDGGIKIVTHVLKNVPEKIDPYCELHFHDFDEINLILSTNNLKYRVQLEDEEYMVDAPSTIYFPKGVRHASEVVSGEGVMVTILFTKDYKAQQ